MDIPVEYNPAIIMRDKGFKMGYKPGQIVNPQDVTDVYDQGVYDSIKSSFAKDPIAVKSTSATEQYMGKKSPSSKYITPSVANSPVKSVFANQKLAMNPPSSNIGNTSTYASGENMYTANGLQYADNGSADGEFTPYNPMDWGRDFGADRGLENGMDKRFFNADGSGKSDVEINAIKEGDYYKSLADKNSSFDWMGGANVALGAATTGLAIYDYFGDGKEMRNEQLGALQDNREYARSAFDDRQAFRKGASGGFDRNSAVV